MMIKMEWERWLSDQRKKQIILKDINMFKNKIIMVNLSMVSSTEKVDKKENTELMKDNFRMEINTAKE